MTKKKDQKISVSQADEAQARSVLGQFHQIAKELHSSTDQKEAETALTAITSMPETAQMALVKALSRERDTDAADVLTAINELSPGKNVRKEARRSLIRLEQEKIYPQWEAPIDRTPVRALQDIQASSNPPRFWKGVVTNSRDVGEVQLMLFWEQGDNYKDVRVLGFLLEFWHDGVKDFFTTVESKRNIDKLVAEMQSQVETLDCSLAKGRRLIQEALEANKKHGTSPHRDYRLHASLVKQLVLEAPDIEEEEEEDIEDEEDTDTSIIDPNMEPTQAVTLFMDAWVDGDFDLAYNLLSADSSLREGLSEEEWIERRDEWFDAADPVRFKPNFLHERETQKTGIWLPNPFSRGRSTPDKVVEVGWSIELDDISENTSLPSLPELPQATVVYKETGRHWFWTSYTLVQEEDGWRIQSMTDEGTNAQGLPVAELQQRIDEHNKRIEDITKKHKPTDSDAPKYLLEILWRAMQIIYYDDALLAQSPLDRSIYLDAASHAILFDENERALVYLERVIHQFPEERGEILRQIGAIQMQLSDHYYEEEEEEEYGDEEERAERFRELAEASLRESLNVENSATGHLLLADLLIESGDDDDLDEAEDHLHQAQELTTDQSELTLIENDLGEICMDRGEYEQALSHGKRILELDPDHPTVWYNIGKTYQAMENLEEARAAFRRSIELHPDYIESYAALVEIYTEEGQLSEAREVLEQGLRANPDSAQLLTILASTYLDTDPAYAEELLEEAEEIDPDSEVVRLFRQVLNISKLEKRSQQKQLPRGKKHRKR